ncbi:hypothetical protein Bca4012_038052 [Brassica carinata]
MLSSSSLTHSIDKAPGEQCSSSLRAKGSLRDHAHAFSFLVVIKSARKFGFLFHVLVEKFGLSMDPYVQNVLMVMYGKYKSVESARKVFDEITQRKVSDWNVMVSGYWRCGNNAEASKVFDMMPECETDVVSWTAMITGFEGYAQNGSTEETLGLFNDVLRLGVKAK